MFDEFIAPYYLQLVPMMRSKGLATFWWTPTATFGV